ncbi:hypothetical protein BKA70DRAFT_1110641 [Coprinopsis sp. MPI-PUGE-AT-0042]|nr:hypothetical protein BKA70DRAFT_1110641 [Coprinopsis sp. MPI-PUGE-AT-0042]
MPDKSKCKHCSHKGAKQKVTEIHELPDLIAFAVVDPKTFPSLSLDVKVKDTPRTYHLKGIIYGDGHHFVSRFISADATIWFHDGIETGRKLVQQGVVSDNGCPDLARCKGKRAVAFLYGLSALMQVS